MGLFGRSKKRLEEAQREAAAELEQAMARAKPPTDAERTWVLPMPEVPDLGIRPRRRVQPRVQFPLPPQERSAPSEPPPTPPAAQRKSRPAAKAQGSAKAAGTAKKSPSQSRSAAKKQPPGTRQRRPPA